MKRAALLLTLLLILASCGDKRPSYALRGQYGSGGDTLLIFGLDYRHNYVDTIVTDKEGSFDYTVKTDTLIPLNIILPKGKILPLYAQPNVEATLLMSDADGPVIKGGDIQALYDSIAQEIARAKERTQREAIIDKFIATHPMSEINIHLLQQHFIETPDAQNSFINTRIEKLGGTLQDNDYLWGVKQKVSVKRKNIVHKAFPEFSFTTADGTHITRSSFLGKYTIVTFWASWDSGSLAHLKRLGKIADENDSSKFTLLNISLDHDTAAWRGSLGRDTIQGNNVCDAQLWDNSLAKEFTIDKLPYSLLLNPYLRINEYGLTADEQLSATIDSLIDKHSKDEQRKERHRKEREKAIKVKSAPNKEKNKTVRGGIKITDDLSPESKIIRQAQ